MLAGGTLAAVVRDPQVKGFQGVHVQLRVGVAGIGVDHGVKAPGLDLLGSARHQGGQFLGWDGFQLVVLHIDGNGELEGLAGQCLAHLHKLHGPGCLILGVGVVIGAHRDAQAGAFRIVALKLGVNVDAAEALVGGNRFQDGTVNFPAALHRVPVDFPLVAAGVQVLINHFESSLKKVVLFQAFIIATLNIRNSMGALVVFVLLMRLAIRSVIVNDA